MKGIKHPLFLYSFLLLLFTNIYFGIGKDDIRPVTAVRKDREWFYDNLNATDRLKIRIAMDYAIPRDKIINDLLYGYAAKVPTPIGPNQIGYDPTIVTRDYNITKSLNLLEEVFGYRYNASADESEGYFTIVIMASTSREDRMEWALLVTNSFAEIGIDTTLKYANENILNENIFNPGYRMGYDYALGGYDAVFTGWPVNPDPDYSFLFSSSAIPPNGENIGLVNNSFVDETWKKALESSARNVQLQALKNFQEWFYESVPMSSICQTGNFLVTDPALEGVDYSGLSYLNYGNWSHSTQNSIRVHSSGTFQNMNPLLAHSNSDFLAIGDNYESLIKRYSTNLTKYHGLLAERWTHSIDNLIWEFKIKEGIKFSDGSSLTVDDVVFSYKMFLDDEVASNIRSSFLYFESPDAVEKINTTSCRFTFTQFYPYAEEYFTIPILSKGQMENIPKGNWSSDSSTNTQYAPVGTGRYMMAKSSTDISVGIVTLVRNPYYDETLRSGTPWVGNPSLERIIIRHYPSIDTTINDLQDNVLDIVDLQSDIRSYFNAINGSSWGKIRMIPSDWEVLVYNNHSPKWGMNARVFWGEYTGPPLDTFPPLMIFLTFSLLSLLGITQIVIILMVIFAGRRASIRLRQQN